jgi:hypothetical protein
MEGDMAIIVFEEGDAERAKERCESTLNVCDRC